MSKTELSVLGDAFIDVIVPVTDLSKGGAAKKRIKVNCGGTANVSVWASRLGVSSSFFGSVGNDCFGRMFKDNLEKENVLDLTQVDHIHSTGICISLVHENERTMVVDRGANDYWNINHVEGIVDLILRSKIVYLVGFSMTSKLNFKLILSILKQNDKNMIWFNPGAYNIINKKIKKFIKNYTDVLLVNLQEAKTILNCDTGIICHKWLVEELNNYSPVVVITLGEYGCVVKDSRKLHYCPTQPIKAIDTTGAGDAFAAGFINGYLRGLSLKECAKFANRVARRVLMRLGAI